MVPPKDASVLAPPEYYSYSDYATIRAALLQIADQYPEIARLYDVGDSWEKTQGIADRDILALKLSDNAGVEEDEPEALIMGLHHAREWPTSELVMAVAETIVASYGDDPRISWLVDNRQLWLVPVVNPDGLDYALTVDDMWRKNRRLNYDLTYGVDLNRNYNGSQNEDPAGAWGGAGTSDDPSNDVYCGEEPFSEPETQAIRDLTSAHNFQIAIDFHTHGDLILWPWSYTWNTTEDDEHLVRIGSELAVLNGYTPDQGIALYPTTGDSTDWMYGKHRVFAYCIEVGDEGGSTADQFHPPGYDTVMGLVAENVPVALEVLEISGDREERGFQIIHEPQATREWSETGFSIEANVTSDRGVDPGSVEVVYRVNGGAWLSSPLVSTYENDTYTGAVPPAPSESVLEYYISAADVRGVRMTSPYYAPYEMYSFVVAGGPPDLPPTILHTPKTASSVGDTAFAPGTGLSVYAEVVDEDPQVDVILLHRPSGSAGAFSETTMVQDQVAPETYGGLVSAGFEQGLEYYISATDSASHTKVSPEDAPASLYDWHNVPAEFGPVTLPGLPPGVVATGESVEISVPVSDDYIVLSVVLRVETSGPVGSDLNLELLSGSDLDGIWGVSISARSTPGVMWLNLSAWDGLNTSYLNGTSLQVEAPLLLELTSDLPELADGSEPIVVTVEASNWTGDPDLRLRLVHSVSGRIHYYLLVPAAESTLTCTLPAGTLLGTYTAIFEGLSGSFVVWSYASGTMEVLDLRLPELVSVDADYDDVSGLLDLQVSAYDAYSVNAVAVYYRIEGEVEFEVAYSVLLAEVGSSSTWNCSLALDGGSGLEYYLVLSDGVNERRCPDGPSFYLFDLSDDGSDEEGGGLLGYILDRWQLLAVALAVALAAGLVTWKRLNREEQV